MKIKFISAIILVFSTMHLYAQDFQRTRLGVKAKMYSGDIEVQFYSDSIVRIIRLPEGGSLHKNSLSVIKNPEVTDLSVNEESNTVYLRSKSLKVALNLKTGSVKFSEVNGTQLFAEKDHGIKFTPIKDADRNSYSVKQGFTLDKDEVIYGLGQQQNGKLNQRNQTVYLQQFNMKVCIPFFQSIKGYGVFWDNYSSTTFEDNSNGTSFNSEVGDCEDYYFMYGKNTDGVVSCMRDLTGQAPMMPLWVYGFNQSREHYKTQFELLNVVKKYRELKIPIDGIIQDWQYWGKDEDWNAMTFDPTNYPRPKAMVDSVHQLNAHLFIVSWPGFGPKTKQYQEFKSKNMLIKFDTWPVAANPRIYDAYNPKARDIYWRYLNAGVFSLGVDAWWLDSTEPDHFNPKEVDFDQPTFLGSYRSVVNAFPLEHTRGVYEHQRATNSNKRVVLLTRSAFAGQQRYSSSTWSGDVVSNWPTLKTQIPAALNFSLTGLPYWNGDIGGFFAGEFVKGGGAKNPDFQELYVRWMQFATFTPMMRSHGTDIPREVYQFGNRGDWAFDVQEQFINLRYALLPYLYSTAWNVTHHSGSFLRPLSSDFNTDKQSVENSSEYLFGSSLLIAPITDKGVKSWPVYLPAGVTWYDFWTGQAIIGGKTIDRTTSINMIPVYVKAGSILPWGPKVQYATEKKWDNLQIRIYPGADGNFTLYEDEKDNYNYEHGKYTEIKFHWNDESRMLTIFKRKGSFTGSLSNRKFNIILVNQTNGLGEKLSTKIDKIINYSGTTINIKI